MLHKLQYVKQFTKSYDYACERRRTNAPRLSITGKNPENPVINCLRRLSGVNTEGRERESLRVKASAKVRGPLAEVFPRSDATFRQQFSQFCGDCTAGVTLQV